MQEKKACIVKKHKRRSDVCTVYGFCRTKEEMLNLYHSGHCLFDATVFDKSNWAPVHLKNVWGHSFLLIKISQRQSLKHIQKVIVDEGKKKFPWRKNAVSKLKKIPLLSNTTKRRCPHISEDLLKQPLDKLKKAQLFGIYLDETTDTSEKVQLILCCRFANQETKNTGELCCLNLGFAQLLKPSSTNWISSLKNMDLIGWSIRQLLQTEQQPCNALLTELFEKSKIFPLTVFQPVFWGDFSVTDRNFLKWAKKLGQFGHNAIFSHKKCPKIKNYWKFLSHFGKMTEMSRRT